MAAEPPPFDFPEEGEGQKEGAGEEDEGLFSDPVAPPSQAEEEVHEPTQEPLEAVNLGDEPAESGPAVPEPDPLAQSKPSLFETEPTPTSAPTLEPRAADDDSEEIPVETKPSAPAPAPKTLDLFEDEEPPFQEETKGFEDEERDGFELSISVSKPEKVGDGMSAYMTYSVTTTTSIPSFRSPETTVRRRFSDFLGLHHKLNEKYLPKGRIVPPAPEKSVVGMTKVKFSKSEESGALFVERRRAALERYLNRLAQNTVLRKDEDFREFLENPSELPKAKDTVAMSGAGFMRLVKNVGESISKIASKKTETDTWFEEQQQNYEQLDGHLKKLNSAIETMIACRKELCHSTNTFAKGIATLGNVEENDSVSRALSRLSEVQEKVEGLHQEQANIDLYTFNETVRDYIAILGSIRTAFAMRVKLHSTWQSSQGALAKKRETEQKLQAGGKPEKLQQVQQEIEELEKKVEEGQANFEEATATLKAEVERFERERAQEFKAKFIAYIEAMMHMQQELIRLWEGYLPDAQAIA